jgi:plasmid replication initiation protein
MKYNQNDLVTKHNSLIEANYRLTVNEQKVILFVASKIQPSDQDFKIYTFSAKEFANMIGLKGMSFYSELKKSTYEIMKKPIQLNDGNKTHQMGWFSNITYNDNEGTINFQFTPLLKPFLIDLQKEFTSYKIKNIAHLKSGYSIRLYELLRQYGKIKTRTFGLEELRGKLGADDVYPDYGNFKQRVLIPAQKELLNKTDLSFNFDEIRLGRRVHKLKFNINITEIQQKELFENDFKLKVTEYGVSPPNKDIERWKNYGEEKIINLLEKIKNKDIKHPIEYINKIVKIEQGELEANEKNNFCDSVLKKVKSSYSISKEPIVEWLVKEKFIKDFQEIGVSLENAEAIWEKEHSSLIADLNKMRLINIQKSVK